MTIVDIQVSPAVLSWSGIHEAALAAEAAGFGAFHIFDHLAGVALGGETMLECFSLLGALSQVTTTIELGTMVVNVWNRQPGTLVSAAASIANLSGRQVHLGIGAGASPTSRWAREQHAAGHELEPDLARRQQRVVDVLDLADRTWSLERDDELATFPLPSPRPSILVGCNSPSLATIAGRHADGINVPWNQPRRDEILAAADDAAGDRPFVRTAYANYDEAVLDPTHPARLEMDAARIDRLVLADFTSSPSFPARV